MKPSDYTRAILVDGVLTTVGGLLEANEEMPDILGDCKVAVAAVLNGADRYILGGGAAALTVISSAHGVRPCAHCNHPVVHCNRCEGWEHTEKDRSCFLSPAPCEDQQNVADIGAPTLTSEEADGGTNVRDLDAKSLAKELNEAFRTEWRDLDAYEDAGSVSCPLLNVNIILAGLYAHAYYSDDEGQSFGDTFFGTAEDLTGLVALLGTVSEKARDTILRGSDSATYVPHATPITTSENLTQRLLTASTILLDLHGWEACEGWGDEDKAMFQGCIDVVTDAAERTGGE